MTTKLEQDICSLADDSRLLRAGPAAFGAHAARLAGFSKEMQEQIARSAVEIAKASVGEPQKSGRAMSRVLLAICNLPDHLEVVVRTDQENPSLRQRQSLQARVAQVNATLRAEVDSRIDWRVEGDRCVLAIYKLPAAGRIPADDLCGSA